MKKQDSSRDLWSQDLTLIQSITTLSPRVSNVNIFLKFWGKMDRVSPKNGHLLGLKPYIRSQQW